MKTIEVVAAIICIDKRILVTQRSSGKFAGYWEFPGGKIEKGESGEDALVREIKEELNADLVIDSFFTKIEYDYTDFHLILYCYKCCLSEFDITLKVHSDAKLISKDELSNLKWLPADYQLLDLIKQTL